MVVFSDGVVLLWNVGNKREGGGWCRVVFKSEELGLLFWYLVVFGWWDGDNEREEWVESGMLVEFFFWLVVSVEVILFVMFVYGNK